MTYEVIITTKQPTCGGQAPTRSEIRNITCEDPLEYVRANETGKEVEQTGDDGVTKTILASRGDLWIRYEFCEL